LASSASDGELELIAYTPLLGKTCHANPIRPVPVGSWFQIEFFLKRAAHATGEAKLYQDGTLLFDETNIVTGDSNYVRWYAGNLSSGVTPPDSIVYMDDVSVSATR
jgi:hypothetical protein